MKNIEAPKKPTQKDRRDDFYQREIEYYENHFGLLVEHYSKMLKIAPEFFLTRLAASDLSKGRGIVEAIYQFQKRENGWFGGKNLTLENFFFILDW